MTREEQDEKEFEEWWFNEVHTSTGKYVDKAMARYIWLTSRRTLRESTVRDLREIIGREISATERIGLIMNYLREKEKELPQGKRHFSSMDGNS